MDYHNSFAYQPAPPSVGSRDDESLSPAYLHASADLLDLQCFSPPTQLVPPWGSLPMQDFLKNPVTSTVFIPVTPRQSFLVNPNNIHPVSLLPPASQRQGSPFSCLEPSSTTSSTGESDFYYDTMPATPNDSSVASFQQPHYLYVNPTEVSPNDFDLDVPADVKPSVFDLSRGFDNCQTGHFDDVDPAAMSVYSAETMASPDGTSERIEPEIHIPMTAAAAPMAYPYPGFNNDPDAEGVDGVRPLEIGTGPGYSRTQLAPKRDGSRGSSGGGSSKHNSQPAQVRRPAKPAMKKAPGTRSDDRPSPKRPRLSGAQPPPQLLQQQQQQQMYALKGNLSCSECNTANFKDETGLKNHIKKQHTRPFTCVFDFAGCQSTFASKNEWKRHVLSQHVLLTYWLCTQDACAKQNNSHPLPGPSSASGNLHSRRIAAPSLPDGAIFNRKDLYTQHIRRMHMPTAVKEALEHADKKKAPGSRGVAGHAADALAQWEDRLCRLQTAAERPRVRLPVHAVCPVSTCAEKFAGKDAWDQRMEHVARHMEKASQGKEKKVQFGHSADRALLDWASGPDVAVIKKLPGGKWVLNNPLRGDGATAAEKGRNKRAYPRAPPQAIMLLGDVAQDEDADGESEY